MPRAVVVAEVVSLINLSVRALEGRSRRDALMVMSDVLALKK